MAVSELLQVEAHSGEEELFRTGEVDKFSKYRSWEPCFHHQRRKVHVRKWENSYFPHWSLMHVDTTGFLNQLSSSNHFAVYQHPTWGRGGNQRKEKMKVAWHGGPCG